ncbi:MAG: 30S ribosomal protein S20 [SAR202 cluster bacterium]|nr:30S ribosomal protein S20 [SAR202 cluster bacterium]
MPAEKTARVQARRQVINRRVRSASRTAVKNAVKSLQAGDPEAPEAVKAAISAVDRAAVKGVIHRNNAANHKSALIKALNKAQAKS